jgi:tRNA (guanine37-N1)-methyltransferase
MIFDIITIFPKIFDGFLTESLLARAQKKGLIKIRVHNLRDWAKNKHRTVDDKPFGGGPGMVLKIEPIYKAVQYLKSKFKSQNLKPRRRVILFSPRGKTFTQADAKRLAKYDQLILICGRYEGVDERVAEYLADEVISIGDYVLSGGEISAMVVIEAISRLIPGVVSKKESVEKLDFPQYTRPEVFEIKEGKKIKKLTVPKILLSGNHQKIAEWRKNHTRQFTSKEQKSPVKKEG